MISLLVVCCLLLCIITLVNKLNRSRQHVTDVLVVIYETDWRDQHLKKYIETLNKFGYQYKLIGDDQWTGFGRKIKTLEFYLNTLPSDQLVVISDARDVLVSRHARNLKKYYEMIARDKILVSAELSCCEAYRKRKPPGSIRLMNGTTQPQYVDIDDPSSQAKWIEEYDKLGNEHLPDVRWKWVNPNAGLYMGKVKDILKLYRLMNVLHDHEDDQSIMSEIILQQTQMFVIDYLSHIFSNSFAWDKKSEELYGGCFYERNQLNQIENIIFHSIPFFVHFPGKHFTCYDRVYDMIQTLE
jgi:hypothetical protein